MTCAREGCAGEALGANRYCTPACRTKAWRAERRDARARSHALPDTGEPASLPQLAATAASSARAEVAQAEAPVEVLASTYTPGPAYTTRVLPPPEADAYLAGLEDAQRARGEAAAEDEALAEGEGYTPAYTLVLAPDQEAYLVRVALPGEGVPTTLLRVLGDGLRASRAVRVASARCAVLEEEADRLRAKLLRRQAYGPPRGDVPHQPTIEVPAWELDAELAAEAEARSPSTVEQPAPAGDLALLAAGLPE